MKKTRTIAAFLVPLVIAPTWSAEVYAQALTPMRHKVSSYKDTAAIRVHAHNPYEHRIRVDVRVYDKDFKLIRARVKPRTMTIAAGLKRSVVVTIPFEGKKRRKFRICAESSPFPGKKSFIRTRVCGRFSAQRAN